MLGLMDSQERYHAFDALRGAMMLLGVALHSATAYATVEGVWWLKDYETSQWMDALIIFIHAFRLPAFFVMAGFFGALLVEKRGWQRFIENRMSRLVLPMILGLLFLLPVLKTISVYAHYMREGKDGWTEMLAWYARGRYAQSIEPMHLWFLETLFWTCLVALALRKPLARLKSGWFRAAMASRWGILVWAAPTFLTLLLTEFGILDTPHGFTPHWHVVLSYYVFFTFGWGLFVNRDRLDALRKFGLAEMNFAVALLPPTVAAILPQLAQRGTRVWWAYVATAALTALTAWLMIYGLCGLFLRRWSAPSPRSRYLADSAYWVYVMHPVALVLIQLPMMSLRVNEWIKFSAGIAFAVPVLFWTYDRFARSTWIGLLLNGKRYPRGLPWFTGKAAAPLIETAPAPGTSD